VNMFKKYKKIKYIRKLKLILNIIINKKKTYDLIHETIIKKKFSIYYLQYKYEIIIKKNYYRIFW